MNAVQFRRLAQEAQDTYRRALVGGYFYLLAWLVVGGYAGAYVHAPLLAWTLALAFIAFATLRFVRRPPQDGDARRLSAWLRVHWTVVMATSTLWSIVFVWSILEPAFEPTRAAALLATLGLATAFAHTFSMRRAMAFIGIAVLYVPGMVLMFLLPDERASAWVMLVYLVYVCLATLRSHTDYQQRLDLDQELRDQRDLFARLSRIDALTELANRRHFSHALGDAIETARAERRSLTLLVLDLDHFKRINDSYGHAVGDACLVEFSSRLRAAFASIGQLPARLGGEEFAVVLVDCNADAAQARAEAFRSALAGAPVLVDGAPLRVTVSVGVAEYEAQAHRDSDELYRAADRAVYRAKSEGRNRVSVEVASCRADGGRVAAGNAAE